MLRQVQNRSSAFREEIRSTSGPREGSVLTSSKGIGKVDPIREIGYPRSADEIQGGTKVEEATTSIGAEE